MIYRPKAAEVEGAEFTLAGGRYVAIALEGAVHTVPAEVFQLLFEQAATRQNYPVSFEETCEQVLAGEMKRAAEVVAEVEATHPDVLPEPQPVPAATHKPKERHPNTDVWNGASSKAQRNPETLPLCVPATIPKPNPKAGAPPKRESPAQEKILRILKEKGPLTTVEIGVLAYPDHDEKAAATNTYPIMKVLAESGMVRRERFAAKNEYGTERPVDKWVAA